LDDKPTAAFVLSLIGGIFLLLGGVAVTIGFSIFFGGIGAIFGIVGVVFGLIVLLGSVMMYNNPQSHTMWGVIILVLSIVALPSIWGFGIGSLLAFIGGILALVYKPMMGADAYGPAMGAPMPMGSMGAYPAYPTQAPNMGAVSMTCKNCGGSIPAGATRCPNCGASL
jgi:hypothetical protein